MARSLRAVAADAGPERSEVPVVSMSPPRKKRPSWVLAGVVLVLVSALLGVYALRAVSDEMSVMVAAHDLVPGQPVTAADLRVVTMGQSGGLRAIQPDQQGLIVGLSPRAPIPAGTVLNTGLFVTAGEVVPAGMAVVGGAFGVGEVPTATLRAGDVVDLIVVAPSTAGVTASPVAAAVVGRGSVWAVSGSVDPGSGSSSRVWVALLIDSSVQVQVAQAAADGRLRLSLVAG